MNPLDFRSLRVGPLGVLLAAILSTQDLDSLRGRIAPEGNALQEELRRDGDTLPGRIAIEERLAELGDALRRRARIEAVAEIGDLRTSAWGPPIEWTSVEFPEDLAAYLVVVKSLRGSLSAVGEAMAESPGIQSRFREFLLSERAAVLYAHHRPLREAPQAHLDWMTFVHEDGKRWVNPHAAGRLAAELDAFEAEWRELEALVAGVRERLGASAEEWWGEGLPAQIRFLLLLGFGGSEEIDELAAWLEEDFVPEGDLLRVREEAETRIGSLLGRAAEVRLELEASPPPIVIDPEALDWDEGKLDLLRSSVFFNPRTQRGWEIYREEFEDHHAARIFGVFDWTVGNSRSFEDALQRLRRRNVWAGELGPTHEKILVYFCEVPRWLSRSSDAAAFQGDSGWQNFKAHSPKDWEPWRELVRETVRLFEGLEDCEVYYEVWNEPDGQYWQEGVDEFLRMYEETVRAVREVDPEAKVGGTAVNQWDGKLRNDPERDPLNLELIRFARKNDVPLDFISWHHFGRPVSALEDARLAYTEALLAEGYDPLPELVITEWSIPYRGTKREGVAMAQMMRALFESKVDVQTMSAWEEFHASPDPRNFTPWGMITQQGFKKPQYHVHRFFDSLGRGSLGVATIELEGVDGIDGSGVVMMSREEDGSHELLLWRTGNDAPTDWTVLDFGEGPRVEVVEAESVGMNPATPFVVSCRSRLALRPARHTEVVRLRVRLVGE